MSDQQKPSPVQKLTELVGYDPAKCHPLTSDLFQEVLKDVNKERIDKVKAQAKELIQKAYDLRCQRDKAEKEYNKQTKKFDEELGKLLNSIQGMIKNVTMEEEKPEEEKEEKVEEIQPS